MTVTDIAQRAAFTGDGTNSALTISFVFDETDELIVEKRVTATGVVTTLTKDVHYTVSGGGMAAGSVTPIDGATDFPFAVTWTVYRATDQDQDVNYVEGDAFPSDSHETTVDRLCLQIQDLQEQIDRCIKIPPSDSSGTTVDLPVSDDRESAYVTTDATGNITTATAALGAADTALVSAFGKTLIDDANAAAARTTLGALASGILTTRGDLFYRDATAEARLAVGADNLFLASDGTDPVWESIAQHLPLRGYIDGFITANNGSDAAHDIDVGPGWCRDSTNAASLVLTGAAFTKAMDATWALGGGNGGMASGVTMGTGWYHLYLISSANGSTVDVIGDSSTVAANALADAAVVTAGLTLYRRIGSFKASAGSILAYTQLADAFFWAALVDEAATDPVDTTLNTETLGGVPTGFVVTAMLNVNFEDAGASAVMFVNSPHSDTGTAPSVTNGYANLGTGTGANGGGGNYLEILTNTSAQVNYRASAAIDDFEIGTIGWRDFRGKDGL